LATETSANDGPEQTTDISIQIDLAFTVTWRSQRQLTFCEHKPKQVIIILRSHRAIMGPKINESSIINEPLTSVNTRDNNQNSMDATDPLHRNQTEKKKD
jgi:hypothetical protein